ncbi:hypothetical protein OF83DRAFT_1175176 [Amylostereum chailletii]|nr:hypothetical protein OF83DRAFT_1175176 [Amylostereum chailletii]
MLFWGDTSSNIHFVEFDLIPDLDSIHLKTHQVEHLDIGTISYIAACDDVIAIASRSCVMIMKEVANGNDRSMRCSMILQVLHPVSPIPFTLHFKSKSILVVAYTGYGLITWNIEECAIVWTLALEPNGLSRTSLSPDGFSIVATRASSGIAWFSILDAPLIPQVVHTRNTSPR